LRTRRFLKPEEENLINLTPLIDVIFVILIMFMIIAPLINLDQVELANGGESKQSVNSQETQGPIQIHVKADNTIWINRVSIVEKDLYSILTALHQQHINSTPTIYHDRRAQFGTYQNLKNSLEKAGFEQMNLILNPL
jgi:biopolymer transport protein ExbD